jgi:putative transcriptional regulator
MAEDAMNAELFEELTGALDEAVAYHRGAKINLRTTVVPAPPVTMSSAAVKELRSSLNLSQAVFAACLNVSTKLVQAWEGGRRVADGAALRLLRFAEQDPSLVFPPALAQVTSNVSRRYQAAGRRGVSALREGPRAVKRQGRRTSRSTGTPRRKATTR